MQKILTIIIMVLVLTHVAPSLGQENNSEIIMETNEKCELTTTQILQTFTQNNAQKKVKGKVKYKTRWIIGNEINVRTKPNRKSKIVKRYYYGQKVKFVAYNKKWAKIKHKNKTYYIYSKYVSKKKPKSNIKSAPNNTMKTYMDYRAITNTASQQYKLQRKAYSGKHGIRQVDGRYCIALGSYYTTVIGKYVDIILSNGVIIPCIISDCKADKDTDARNIMHPDGSLVEFVVDTNTLDSMAKRMGDISYAQKDWHSRVSKVKIYNKVERF